MGQYCLLHKRHFRLYEFVGSHLSYPNSGLIIDGPKFEPGIEQQNYQISNWYVIFVISTAAQQSFEVKNTNFRKIRPCMESDSCARSLSPPYFARWSSARWNQVWCSSKVINFPGNSIQGWFNEGCPILDIFFSSEQIIQLECTSGLKIGRNRSVWARGQNYFVSW